MNQKSILIVDDDPDLCTLMTNALKRLHFLVECTYSLKDGLKRISEIQPFLIFLDHNLPDGKGLNVINNIKKKSRCKVIVMSADPSHFVRTLALKRGADDFIEKPFKTEDITTIAEQP